MNKQLQRLMEKMNKIKAQGEAVKPYFNAIENGIDAVIKQAENDKNIMPASLRQLKTLQTCTSNAIKRRIEQNNLGIDETENNTENKAEGVEVNE